MKNFPWPYASILYQDDLSISNIIPTMVEKPNAPPKSLKF